MEPCVAPRPKGASERRGRQRRPAKIIVVDHRVSEHVLAAWHDLNHLAAGSEALTFVSLFDDAADVWADEDFRLVEPLSTVAHWSRSDEFAAVLRDAT